MADRFACEKRYLYGRKAPVPATCELYRKAGVLGCTSSHTILFMCWDWMTKLVVADEVAAHIEPRRAMAILMNVKKPLQTSDNIFMTEWVAIFRESGLRDDVTIARRCDHCEPPGCVSQIGRRISHTKPTAKSGDVDFDENAQADQEEPEQPQEHDEDQEDDPEAYCVKAKSTSESEMDSDGMLEAA